MCVDIITQRPNSPNIEKYIFLMTFFLLLFNINDITNIKINKTGNCRLSISPIRLENDIKGAMKSGNKKLPKVISGYNNMLLCP